MFCVKYSDYLFEKKKQSKCIYYKEQRILNKSERLTSAGRKEQTVKTMRFSELFLDHFLSVRRSFSIFSCYWMGLLSVRGAQITKQ